MARRQLAERQLTLRPLSRFKPRAMLPYHGPGAAELYAAVRAAFPDAHPDYHHTIVHRYRSRYDVPVDAAVRAIGKRYISPSAAWSSGVIKLPRRFRPWRRSNDD